MKISGKLLLMIVGLVFLTATLAGAVEGRKLPAGAYIKSAKIALQAGDMGRYPEAIAMLDSLIMWYGPNSEGLSLMSRIMVDYIDKNPDLAQKKIYLAKFKTFEDSLHMCCESKEIEKKFQKDCDTYIALADSTRVKYWREFYNAAVAQLGVIDNIKEELATTDDSSAAATMKADIQANVDSIAANMEMAILLDPNDYRAYVALGSAYEKIEDYKKANEWLEKGVPYAEDPNPLLMSLAYNTSMKLDDYCGAIKYFQKCLEINPTDEANLVNLSICFSNCQMYDSALAVSYRILTVNPGNTDALRLIALYHNQRGRDAADSSSVYQTAQNEALAKKWRDEKEMRFDSSSYYFAQMLVADPHDMMALEQYGTITAIRGNFAEAAKTFAHLAELKPDEVDYWRFLGDCQLQLQEWDKTIAAYEKVVELEPTDRETWERLRDLYAQVGNKAKQAEVEKKLQGFN